MPDYALLPQPIPEKICPKVVVRTKDNLFYFGELKFISDTYIELSNSRQLTEWRIDCGVGMSGLANHGLSNSRQSFLTEIVNKSYIFDVAEIIVCNDTAASSIEKYQFQYNIDRSSIPI
jgi:hypothetical protein